MFSKLKNLKASVMKYSPQELTEKLHKAALSYEKTIASANKVQATYMKDELPVLFHELQRVEETRLHLLKKQLKTYGTLSNELALPFNQLCSNLTSLAAQINPTGDLREFVETFLSEFGRPATDVHGPFQYELNASPQDIKDGKMDVNPNSPFKASLEKCMELQRESHPSAYVPVIMTSLIASIRATQDGFAAEGIFRVSAQLEELTALQLLLEDGSYDKIKVSSPHVPAALLKKWLRELENPLIQTEKYPEVIEAASAKGKLVEPSKLSQIYKATPALARMVIGELCTMCVEVLKEENAATNRMSWDNLAIVFAPSFLRCPSEVMSLSVVFCSCFGLFVLRSISF